ncbi:unnamed protein product, partial [Ectocarpus sp. 8 AP-2014]
GEIPQVKGAARRPGEGDTRRARGGDKISCKALRRENQRDRNGARKAARRMEEAAGRPPRVQRRGSGEERVRDKQTQGRFGNRTREGQSSRGRRASFGRACQAGRPSRGAGESH